MSSEISQSCLAPHSSPPSLHPYDCFTLLLKQLLHYSQESVGPAFGLEASPPISNFPRIQRGRGKSKIPILFIKVGLG